MAYFDTPNFGFATSAVVILSVILVGLFIGWFFGARRLNLNLHHSMVYTATGIVLVIILIWMGPRIVKGFNYLVNNFPNTSVGVFHAAIGLLVLILMLTVSLAFIFRKTIPLNLLKKMRYLMITIIILFPIVFGLGIANYMRYF